MKKICTNFGTTLGDFKNYLYFYNRIPVQGILQGIMGALTGKIGNDITCCTPFGHISDCFIGSNNFYEDMAYHGYWWDVPKYNW